MKFCLLIALKLPNWSKEHPICSDDRNGKKVIRKSGNANVNRNNIEKGYVPEEELQKHVDADLVILQMPVNWFGAPWIYKNREDEVFNAGLHSKVLLDNDGRTRSDPSRQYGTGGHMHGHKFMIAATWNAPQETFANPESVLFEGSSTDDLLLNISSNYKFTGYDVLPSFGILDIYNKVHEIKDGLSDYKKYLESLASSEIAG